MPRKRKPFAEIEKPDFMYGPAASYSIEVEKAVIVDGQELRPTERCLVPSGDIIPRYHLDSQPIQKALLDEYIKIENETAALEWIEQCGLPAYNPQSPSFFESRVRLIIASAQSLRDLLEINNILKEDFPLLKTYIEEKSTRDTQQTLVYFKIARRIFSVEMGGFREHRWEGRTYNKNYWLRYKNECINGLAHVLLADAANIMLKGVQPSFDWHYYKDSKTWVPLQGFSVHCPWHAMSVEFARRITKTTVRLDYCVICNKPLIGKRSDARTCDRYACQKADYRNRIKLSA